MGSDFSLVTSRPCSGMSFKANKVNVSTSSLPSLLRCLSGFSWPRFMTEVSGLEVDLEVAASQFSQRLSDQKRDSGFWGDSVSHRIFWELSKARGYLVHLMV